MEITLGNYYSGSSAFHRMDPRLKLIGSVVLMVSLFFLNRWEALLGYAFGLWACAIVSRIPLKLVLRSVRSVLFLAVFAWILNLFTTPGEPIWNLGPVVLTWEGLRLGTKLAIRLFFLILTTSLLLTLVTTPLAVSAALERLLAPLERVGFPAHELAMMLSIALRFVPTLAEETDKLMKAQSSRGADFDTGGLLTRVRGLVTVLIPLFVYSFKRAEELALAMEARCYRGGKGRTKLHVLNYCRLDAQMLALLVLWLLLLFFLEWGPLPWRGV